VSEGPSAATSRGRRPALKLGDAFRSPFTLGNERGRVRLHARLFDGVQHGVLISEGIWPNGAFIDGQGINVLTGDDSPAPFGGAAVHDNRVWLKPA